MDLDNLQDIRDVGLCEHGLKGESCPLCHVGRPIPDQLDLAVLMLASPLKEGEIFRRKETKEKLPHNNMMSSGPIYDWTQERGHYTKLEELKVEGHDWIVSQNYQCLNKWSDEQRIQHLGWTLTVWATWSSITSDKMQIDANIGREQLVANILELGKKVDAGCRHLKATSKTIGRCLHEYTCPECGSVWTIDSSD